MLAVRMERALMPMNVMKPDPVFSTSRKTASHAFCPPVQKKADPELDLPPKRKKATHREGYHGAALTGQTRARLKPDPVTIGSEQLPAPEPAQKKKKKKKPVAKSPLKKGEKSVANSAQKDSLGEPAQKKKKRKKSPSLMTQDDGVTHRVAGSASRSPGAMNGADAINQVPINTPNKSGKSPAFVEVMSTALTVTKDPHTDALLPVPASHEDIFIDATGYKNTTEARIPVTKKITIIPGKRKRVRAEDATKSIHLDPRTRSMMILAGAAAFLLLTLFSLSPLSDTYTGLPIVGDAIQLVHNGQASLAILIGDHAPSTQKDPPAPTEVPAPPAPMIASKSDYVAIAQQAAQSAGISPYYFVRQINQESGFNPYAVSRSGAVGIAQFMPQTAANLGVNPYDPVSALYGAAKFMATLNNSFYGDYAKALAGYNAGSAAVNRAVAAAGSNWLSYMPLETQNYVRNIMY